MNEKIVSDHHIFEYSSFTAIRVRFGQQVWPELRFWSNLSLSFFIICFIFMFFFSSNHNKLFSKRFSFKFEMQRQDLSSIFLHLIFVPVLRAAFNSDIWTSSQIFTSLRGHLKDVNLLMTCKWLTSKGDDDFKSSLSMYSEDYGGGAIKIIVYLFLLLVLIYFFFIQHLLYGFVSVA